MSKLRVEGSRWSRPLRIGIDSPLWQVTGTSTLEITRVADGRTFESRRVQVGGGSAISVWVAGLPAQTTAEDVSIRLNGSDLPAVWLAPNHAARQINALLPAGLEPDDADVSVVFRETESRAIAVELYRS